MGNELLAAGSTFARKGGHSRGRGMAQGLSVSLRVA
jgi:hypothetical protein